MNGFIVLLGVICTIVGASGKCESPAFTCNKNNLQEVFLKEYNVTVKCEETHQCNTILVDCQPCIQKSDTCYDQFKCLSETSVQIGDKGIFNCIEYEVCNSEFVQPCSPCITKICDEPKFSCDPNDNTLVYKFNMVFKCASGYFCNSENKLPCTECINNEGYAGRSIFQFML